MEKYKKEIIIAVVVILGFFLLLVGPTGESMNSSNSNYRGSSSSSYSNGSSYSGDYSSGSSSYDPADYDSKGNYKPVESMTKKKKKDELTKMLEDRLY